MNGPRVPKSLAAFVFGLAMPAASLVAAAPSAIHSVSLSRPFFNPTLGQKIQVSLVVDRPGLLDLLILDRDGFPVRKLVTSHALQAGKVGFEWDGRDDKGEVIPDEAYSLKIDLTSEGVVDSYFPALASEVEVKAVTNYYDRRGATLSYRLARPSRVHIQAGVAEIDPVTKKPEGPVLRTLVNREPRPAGSVIENWNGYDEGRTFYVPDLPHFAMSVFAVTLPDNAIISNGNRVRSFLERAALRKGTSLIPSVGIDHAHHRGLTAIQDVAPRLKAAPTDASWSATERCWSPRGGNLHISVALEGPSSAAFEREPGALYVFVDRKRVFSQTAPQTGTNISIPLGRLSPGSHVVAVNWASAYGPVAVDAFQIAGGKSERFSTAAFK